MNHVPWPSCWSLSNADDKGRSLTFDTIRKLTVLLVQCAWEVWVHQTRYRRDSQWTSHFLPSACRRPDQLLPTRPLVLLQSRGGETALDASLKDFFIQTWSILVDDLADRFKDIMSAKSSRAPPSQTWRWQPDLAARKVPTWCVAEKNTFG